jgi:hypothetical protein
MILPILEMQIVPPFSSLTPSFPSWAKSLNLFSYSCISIMLKDSQFLMLGTTNPLGESMAMLILWASIYSN